MDAYWQPLPSELGSIESPIGVLTDDEQKLLRNVQAEVLKPPPNVPIVPTGKTDLFSPF